MAIKYVCQFKTLFKCQQAMKCTQTLSPTQTKLFTVSIGQVYGMLINLFFFMAIMP